MDVFIHEDYVNKRNAVRREQRKKVQMQELQLGPASGNPGGLSRPAPARRTESTGATSRCTTPTSFSPSTLGPTASEEAVSSDHRRLFDCLKPY